MADRQPSSTTNLDRYGNAELAWGRAVDALNAGATAEVTWFLGTTRPDGRPHAAGVGGVWHDGNLYFTSSPDARKARNLARDPRCTVSVRLEGIDLIVEGDASRVTDGPTLERLAAIYRDGGWPAEVDDDAFTAPFSAPSAGPPPWQLYRLTPQTVFGVASAEPHGATRWQFA
jgi:hypothetical protein